MPTIVNVRGLPANSPGIVYCGRSCAGWRGSPLANPFRLSGNQTRETVLRQYDEHLRRLVLNRVPEVLQALAAITEGSFLGCWCHPQSCHCEVIIQVWAELTEAGII